MNLVFIENAPGSGQTIIVFEAFANCVVPHRLEPGDSARIVMSRFKSIVIDEEAVATQGLADPAGYLEKSSAGSDGLSSPAGPPRRKGGRVSAYRLSRPVGREIRADDHDPKFNGSEKIALSE